MTTVSVSVHYTFPGFRFMDHWETFDISRSEVSRIIRDAERDAAIDMYVVGGLFHRKGE